MCPFHIFFVMSVVFSSSFCQVDLLVSVKVVRHCRLNVTLFGHCFCRPFDSKCTFAVVVFKALMNFANLLFHFALSLPTVVGCFDLIVHVWCTFTPPNCNPLVISDLTVGPFWLNCWLECCVHSRQNRTSGAYNVFSIFMLCRIHTSSSIVKLQVPIL